jgi:hypothetical protein
VLAILYLQNKQDKKALKPVSILKSNYPNHPDYQQLFKAVGL